MSNRTFACLYRRKLQRNDQNIKAFFFPLCGHESVCVHWKLHVSPPKKVKKWNLFWDRYLHELRQIEEFMHNPHIVEIRLSLLNQVFRRQPK